jgi:MFS family permease
MRQEFLSFPRSAKLYLINEFLVAGFYTWPFWFGFANERISASQFGVFIATTYIVGLIAEVPTGAFADSFGRKRSALLGALCEALVPIIIYAGGNFTAYMVAAVVTGIGSAFISGSLESLLYELPDMTRTIYRRVMVHDTFFFQPGLIISSATGGLMYRLHHGLPFAMQALSFVAAAFVVSRIDSDVITATRDPGAKSSKKHRFLEYVRTNKEGFLHLFGVRLLWPLILFASVLGMLQWISIEYLNEAAMIHYAIDPAKRGLIIAGVKILALLLLNFIILRALKNDRRKLIYLGGMALVVFGLYSLGVMALFLLGFVGFNLISSVRDSFIKPIIHDHIESRWRATSISSYSFACNVLQALASLGAGVLLQRHGAIFVQRVFLALLLVVALPAGLRFLSRQRAAELE